jgi:hypothetical protein
MVGSTIGTTSEPGERYRGIPLPGSSSSESVWYRWVAPSNGFFSFFADGASLLELYQGDTFNESNLLAAGANPHIVLVTGGTEYRLAVVSGDRFTLQIRPARRPANDNFSNRQVISGLLVGFGVNAQDATAEPGEPPFQAYYPARRSVWFSWTAPTNGGYLLRSTNYDRPRISVYRGDALTALTLIASGQESFGVEFTARAATTYQIAVEPDSHYGYYGYSAELGLELSYRPPPRNDDFANRLRLAGATVSITASNVGATLEPGEPFNSTYAGGQTVWWTWRAPRTGRATFAVNLGAILTLYTGSWPTRLIPLTDTNDFAAEHNVPVQAGVDYQISVDRSIWSSSGQFQLGIRYTTAPANDNFAQRKSFTDVAAGELAGGSLETGEPPISESRWNSSMWWTWTAPSNAIYRFESDYFDGSIEVFTGNTLAELQELPSSRYEKHVQVKAGTHYVIRVVGRATAAPYTLKATLIPPPANDNFADRVRLAGTNISITAANVGATHEPGETFNPDRAGGQTVWWTWQASQTGRATFALKNFSGVLNLYTGTELAGLTSRTDTNVIRQEYNIPVEAGVDYQISVDRVDWYDSGQFDLSIRYTSTPPNDDFTQRQPFIDLGSGNLEGGSVEADEPEISASEWTSSVWWAWTAPSNGTYRFEATAEPYFYGDIELFTGDTLAELIRVDQERSSSNFRIHVRVTAETTYAVRVVGSGTGSSYTLTATFVPAPVNDHASEYNLPVQVGVDYQVSVDRLAWYRTGEFDLSIRYTSIPVNDDFARRQPFTNLATGELEGASLEADEYAFESSIWNASVWWIWTAPSNGYCRFEAKSQAYPYPENSISLLSGDRLADLEYMQADPSHPNSYIYVQVTAGTTYMVRVAGSGTSPAYTLTAAFAPAPVNDNFAERLPLTGTNISVVGSNRTATAQAGESEHKDTTARKSVWWSWTAPSSGSVLIALPQYSHHRIAIYTGDVLESLQAVSDGDGTARFDAVRGSTYQVAIDTARWSMDGSDEFTWSLILQEQTPPVPLLIPAGIGALGIVETSTNLVDWVPYTNAPVNPSDFRIVPSTNEPYRFFRMR